MDKLICNNEIIKMLLLLNWHRVVHSKWGNICISLTAHHGNSDNLGLGCLVGYLPSLYFIF